MFKLISLKKTINKIQNKQTDKEKIGRKGRSGVGIKYTIYTNQYAKDATKRKI